MLRSRNGMTTDASPVGESGSARTLRLILSARAVWNASFALYLLQFSARSVAALLEAFVQFAIADGILALAMAVAYLIVTPRRMLWLSPATDAATRAYSPGGNEEQVREAVRLAVRRCATLWTGKKPLVEVMLLQVAQ